MQDLSFTEYLRCELRKFTTTPAWWIIGSAMVAFSVFICLVVLLGALQSPHANLVPDNPESLGAVYNLPAGVALIFALVLGVLGVTHEYQTRTIGQTLLAGPDRRKVYAAKVAAAAAAGVLFAVLSLVAVTAVAATVVSARGMDPYLNDPQTWQRIGGALLVLTLWAVMGAGLGALVRNQLLTVAAVLVLSQAVEPLLRAFTGDAGRFFPGAVADQASGGTLISMAMGQDGLSQAAALGVFAAYTLIALIAGAVRFHKYEVQ